MKKVLIFIISVFCFSQANANVMKCKDLEGHVYYTADKNTVKKYIKKGMPCESVVRTRKITAEERLQLKKEAEARYREKVRATAKFLDDVEAARKNK